MSQPPEPRANPELVGQEGAALALRDATGAGRPHHAWLLAGPQGVGKATLAFRYARWLLAGAPEARVPLELAPADPVFSRVANGAHADLRTLSPEVAEGKVKRQISVDEARAVPRFLSMTPAEGGWRVVVVDEAHALNTEAQNALLKTLEEPPARAVLLLATEAPDRLLPTVRSRCRRLDLVPLTDEAMDPLLARWWPEMPEAERATLRTMAAGSPGRALRLVEGEALALQAEVEAFLNSLPNPSPRGLHGLADRLAAKRDGSSFTTFLALLRAAIAGAIRQAGRGGPAPAWLGARPLADWATLWDTLGRTADETEALNLDRKQAILVGLGALAGSDAPR
ncbi:DNA polymerase III subunit delta' [Roseomonas elaeocarpi]|uniref:DNA polymerase III subunit delta n=1 Tax=Roseomonas elaeocarpi TaxID=907779 RepID=A0ABV6JXV0_9PROT